MGPNELLFWLSARSSGSWHQFRSAVEEIISDGVESKDGGPEFYPLYQRLRFSLQSLAHVEFDAEGCENGWRITPPVLALSNACDACTVGILCGARLPPLISRLEELGGVAFERHSAVDQPDIIRMAAPRADMLLSLAETAGIRVQKDAPAAILGCLPPIDLALWPEVPLPFGKDWSVERFEIRRKLSSWVESSVAEAKRSMGGLFRFSRFHTYEHYLRASRRTFRCVGQAGKFFLLAQRGKQVLRYDRNTASLSVPAIFRPPFLTERALVLCSGFLPYYEPASRLLVYRNIPESIAAFAGYILRQPGI